METATLPSPRPGVEYLPGDLVAEYDAEGWAALDDIAWINEQYNRGALREYDGFYIGVVGKKVLGHNKSIRKLREDVTRATGHTADRIVISLIDRPTR